MTADRLAALQRPDGGFESVVTSRQGRTADCNGFTAAIVLRTIRHVSSDAVLTGLRQRALGFLVSCASVEVPGAFSFWPAGQRPAWAALVPADVDDTALMLTELLRAGWITRAEALKRICYGLLPHRVAHGEAGEAPSWIAPGSFYTWIVPGSRGGAPNIVDCCVNANVVALMALIEAPHLPGYAAAIQTIRDAISWAAGDPRRLSAVTPFYQSVSSLSEAIAHAVECGAAPLAGLAGELTAAAEEADAGAGAGCCRSAYGSTEWHCEAIHEARALARSARHRTAAVSGASNAVAG
jgi:hypothetical protein